MAAKFAHNLPSLATRYQKLEAVGISMGEWVLGQMESWEQARKGRKTKAQVDTSKLEQAGRQLADLLAASQIELKQKLESLGIK